MHSRRLTLLSLLLAGCGAAVWVGIGTERIASPGRWIATALAIALSKVPALRQVIWRALGRIREPSIRATEWCTVMVAVGATTYFIFTAFNQERDLFPKTHDEGSYALQVQMLAHGRLWMPSHPLADFFDTFYVITRPVYASLYFPGAAMMYVPAVWLGWPDWALPVLIAGAIVGLVYRLTSELIDGVAGFLAALMMASISEFRMLSMLRFSHTPVLLLGLLLVWAWLRWRRELHPGWAITMGAFAGWAAITRPVDALCFAIPVGVAILLDLRDTWRRTLEPPSKLKRAAPALAVAGAAPFLMLQLIFNVGVTGRTLETPYTFYLHRDQPNTSFGFHAFDPSAGPQSVVPQKQDYYSRFMLPYIRSHQPDTVLPVWARTYFPMVVDATLPSRAMLPLASIGLLGLVDRRRIVLWMSLPLLIGLYVFNTFFLEHYGVLAAPGMILLVLLGIKHLELTWPRWREQIAVTAASLCICMALTSLHEFNRKVDDEPFHSAMMNFIHNVIPTKVAAPAVILFRYTTGDPIIEEPVYNSDVAWPDDAPIVHAHDLGERDLEIFRYYSRMQPQRMFYLYDRKSQTLSPLGSAVQLAADPPPGMGGRSSK